jgi:tetratricopeptide (TPR) repeat protein
MRYITCRLGWLVVLMGFALRADAQDTVYFYDSKQKKEADVQGTIQEESPAGIKIQVDGAERLVSSLDVTQVTYNVGGISAVEFRKGDADRDSAIRERDPDKQNLGFLQALRQYEDILLRVGTHPFAPRYFQFRIAEVKLLMSKNDPAKKTMAVAALKEFTEKNPQCWEVVPALKLLADTHEQDGNVEGAMDVYQKLADLPGLPVAAKARSNMLVANLLLRQKRHADAEKRLTTVLRDMKADDPDRPGVQIYLIQTQLAQGKVDGVEQEVKSLLAASEDPMTRSAAYNLLGDFHAKKNQPEEAFWAYLRVDVLYSKDRAQHAKALYNLWKLFDKAKGDPIRAQQCYERLMDKQFAGTEHQELARSEKPPE